MTTEPKIETSVDITAGGLTLTIVLQHLMGVLEKKGILLFEDRQMMLKNIESDLDQIPDLTTQREAVEYDVRRFVSNCVLRAGLHKTSRGDNMIP